MYKIGERVGQLTLLERKRENNRTYFLCKCDCGNTKWIRVDSLKSIKSCGCLTKFKPKDLRGKKFGRLTAIAPTNKRDITGSVIWNCKCSCGNCKEVSSKHLLMGKVLSCGCLGREKSRKNIKKAIEKHLEKHIVEETNLQVIDSKKLMSNNVSGATGVTWDKSRNLWKAEIEFKGKRYYLGRFKDKKEAITVREKGEKEFFKPIIDKYKK